MPTRPGQPCRIATCPNLKPCPRPGHERRPFESNTPRSPYAGNGWAWQRTVAQVVAEEPYCRLRLPGVSRRQAGRDPDRRSNLQGACRACNEAKRRQQAVEARR
jgi:hypothetical protein